MSAAPRLDEDSDLPDEPATGDLDQPADGGTLVEVAAPVPLRERVRRPDADTWPLLALGLAAPIGLALRVADLDLLYVAAGTLAVAVAAQLIANRLDLLRRVLARDRDPRRRLRIWITTALAGLFVTAGVAWVVLSAADAVGVVLVWLLGRGVWVTLALLGVLALWVRRHRAARDPSSVPVRPPT